MSLTDPGSFPAEFEPALGDELFGMVTSRVLGLGDGWDWQSQVQKDLRSVLGRPEKGRYSRIYCGGPRRQSQRGSGKAQRACRKVLLSSLADAFDAAKQDFGPDPSGWQIHATGCEDDPICDQIEPNTAGAVETPPFPWQNRGTYHQVTEVAGHR
jgi:hypothetical protein